MTETQQSPQAIPEAQELSAAEGSRNAEVQASTPPASQSAAPAQDGGGIPKELEFINRTTGRNYKTLEDAEKGLKETTAYVGTLGQKSAVLDKLAKKIARENNISEEAAVSYVASLAQQEEAAANSVASEAPVEAAPAKTARTPQDFQTEMMKEQLNELQLLRKYPEAEAHVDLIKRVARADGRDFAEIYEKDIKPLVGAGKQQAYDSQASKGAASVASSNREAPVPDTYAETFKAFQNGRASVMDVLKAKGLRISARE